MKQIKKTEQVNSELATKNNKKGTTTIKKNRKMMERTKKEQQELENKTKLSWIKFEEALEKQYEWDKQADRWSKISTLQQEKERQYWKDKKEREKQ